MSRPRVLFLAHLLPWPLDGGGQIKSFHILRELARDCDIKLLAYARPGDDIGAAVEALSPYCSIGIETVPLVRKKWREALTAASALVTGASFLVRRDDLPAMRDTLRASLRSVDVVHVDHLQIFASLPTDTGGARIVLDQHNVEHRIPERIAESAGKSLKGRLIAWYARGEAKRLAAFEQGAIRRAELTLAVSDEDRDSLGRLAPDAAAKIRTLPIGVDTDFFAPSARNAGADRLVSIGTMYWPPNVDAMLWFCERILPKIRSRVAGAQLDIVGARPTSAIVALGETPGVIVTGLVPDVRPYGERCGVFIVPLRSGSGMRVKILNALSMGLPVVSTTVGAEGIEIVDGEHLLLADTEEEFADAVCSLLADPARAKRLGDSGRALMEEKYGWEAIGRRLRHLYNAEIFGIKEGIKVQG